MPTPDALVNSLALVTNEWRWLATAWHATILAILAYAFWRRPSQRTIAMLLALPMISVSALAWWSGNPFNGAVFMALALLMVLSATRMDKREIAVGPPVRAAAGMVLFALGFVYPHFLVTNSWTPYLYASPFGLIPCATLAVVTGISLSFDAFASRAWAVGSVAALLTYGIIGVAVLGVWIDAMLIGGALALMPLVFTVRESASSTHALGRG